MSFRAIHNQHTTQITMKIFNIYVTFSLTKLAVIDGRRLGK